MNEYKYEIKVKADGYWVGYRDKNGEWQDADNEPYDSFIDAVKYRDFIEERETQPVSTASNEQVQVLGQGQRDFDQNEDDDVPLEPMPLPVVQQVQVGFRDAPEQVQFAG